jgi:hypothetical protein
MYHKTGSSAALYCRRNCQRFDAMYCCINRQQSAVIISAEIVGDLLPCAAAGIVSYQLRFFQQRLSTIHCHLLYQNLSVTRCHELQQSWSFIPKLSAISCYVLQQKLPAISCHDVPQKLFGSGSGNCPCNKCTVHRVLAEIARVHQIILQ